MPHRDGVSRRRKAVQGVAKGLRVRVCGRRVMMMMMMLGAPMRRANKPGIAPRCSMLGVGEMPAQAGSASPATPTLCLRVKWAETAIASPLPKLSSRSAFLCDTQPCRGGKCKRENFSVDSLLSPLLTTLPPSSQTTSCLLAGNKRHLQSQLASGSSSAAPFLASKVGPDCAGAVWTPQPEGILPVRLISPPFGDLPG